jgi:type IV pilus assembly protein PilV
VIISRNRKGFTLIEALVGMIILAVGLLAIAGMLLTSVKGNYFSNHLTQASYIAQDRLEYLKTLPITHASLIAGTHTSQPEAGPVTSSGQVFSRSYTVVVNGNLRTITYTVTWNDGRDHIVSFTTMRSL